MIPSNGDAIRDALQEHLPRSDERGRVLTKYLAVGVSIDQDGNTNFSWCASEDAQPWDILGMLAYTEHRLKAIESETDA